jgi:class 3 adenylate cyclase
VLFDRPAAAVECALSLVRSVHRLGVESRAGLFSGEVEIVGDDVAGLAVHIAARVAALGSAGEVLVSRTVRDLLVGSGIRFSERGTHALRGIPEEWQLYEATST